MEQIDYSDNSLTVSWPEVPGAKRYVLHFREATSVDFQSLSEKLTTTQARKRNLEAGDYFFRAGAVKKDEEEPSEWISHQDAFRVLSKEQEKRRMSQPNVQPAGNQAVKVSWNSVDGAKAGYELQMRENVGGAAWSTIASSLQGSEVRKKNLTSSFGFMFRVREADSGSCFSIPSEVARGGTLSDGVRRVFSMLEDGQLLRDNKTPVPVADALAGKEFILLYASAHWCPPCRQFTPMLMNWYHQVKNKVEVVFLSADHDERGFSNYYGSMPWTAVPFDDDGREQLMGWIKVTGIPRLVVLDGKTGRILVDNAVGQPLDIAKWRQLASK